jgi:alpha-tubulin suppressor-like RCC1 family protein
MNGVYFSEIKLSKFLDQASAFALDEDGRVFAWGQNNLGQLGHGDNRHRKMPTLVQALKRKRVT